MSARIGRTCLVAIAAAGVLWGIVVALDAAGSRGYFGPVVENNLDGGIDATPLFYTELEP